MKYVLANAQGAELSRCFLYKDAGFIAQKNIREVLRQKEYWIFLSADITDTFGQKLIRAQYILKLCRYGAWTRRTVRKAFRDNHVEEGWLKLYIRIRYA